MNIQVDGHVGLSEGVIEIARAILAKARRIDLANSTLDIRLHAYACGDPNGGFARTALDSTS